MPETQTPTPEQMDLPKKEQESKAAAFKDAQRELDTDVTKDTRQAEERVQVDKKEIGETRKKVMEAVKKQKEERFVAQAEEGGPIEVKTPIEGTKRRREKGQEQARAKRQTGKEKGGESMLKDMESGLTKSGQAAEETETLFEQASVRWRELAEKRRQIAGINAGGLFNRKAKFVGKMPKEFNSLEPMAGLEIQNYDKIMNKLQEKGMDEQVKMLEQYDRALSEFRNMTSDLVGKHAAAPVSATEVARADIEKSIGQTGKGSMT